VQIEDVTLIADRGKLRLILENLLSNAVKYSPKGGSIHLRASTTGEALVIDVADSGSGIAPEDRAHIFDAFYTGRAAKGSSLKGTGIGLSVVMEIIDGTYTGAHFRITMPTRPAGSTPPASADSKERRAHAA
jgi:two-component system sensor histidine kinase GlrK